LIVAAVTATHPRMAARSIRSRPAATSDATSDAL
jgi:hypothetical protein